MSNLGNLRFVQGKPDEMKKMFCRTLEEFEQAYGPNRTSILQLACNLVHLCIEYHELDKAEATQDKRNALASSTHGVVVSVTVENRFHAG
jgi:hypothetical protein